MNVCILGAGGLGCVLGGGLAESGVEVTLVARPQHVGAIRERGLRINGISGDRVVTDHLRAVSDARDVEGDIAYLVLLVKAKDTEQALAGAAALRDRRARAASQRHQRRPGRHRPPARGLRRPRRGRRRRLPRAPRQGKDTERALADAASLRARIAVAFSLQNPVVKEEALSAWLGGDRVIGASTTEAGTLVGPGEVRHTATAPTSCYFGELDGRHSERVATLVDVFTGAGFSSAATDEIAHVEWEKLLQISVMAGWSASTMGAFGGSVAEGLGVREAAEHYVQLATELLAVYHAIGYEPRDFFAPFSSFRRFEASTFDEAVEQAMELGAAMRERGVIGRPSLHDDLLRGKETEVDYCLGAFLGEAEKRGVAVPTARATYRIVKTLEQLGRREPS